MQHVATWKEGEAKWAYHDDAFEHIATHKVSLDPYRLESRRILACIKETLPAPPLQRVEKASVDEVFLDLSAQVHSILLERYPEISGPPPYDDPTENLPRPPTTALDWNTDALVDLDDSETEDDDPDWDDIVMVTASEIVRGVRAAIRERLKYTCSAGIARNKMIAKLGSAHKKPNQQTIVRNRAVQQFLGGFKFTKIRNLGGKLGDEVVSNFATDEVKNLLPVSLDQMKSKLGDDTGSWVYYVIRGEDSSAVNARTQIKSMLSAKSFRPTINSRDQAVRWLRIFVADIFSRLVEEGVLENKRRPKTINLHHRQGGETRSRQAPIPSGRAIDEALLFDISKNILGQIEVDGRLWPCANLSLAVAGFEDGPTGNKGIGSFLVRGNEAKNLAASHQDETRHPSPAPESTHSKRLKTQHGALPSFFERHSSSYGEPDDVSDGEGELSKRPIRSSSPTDLDTTRQDAQASRADDIRDSRELAPIDGERLPQLQTQASIASYFCERCKATMPESKKEEHHDWHFARDLQASERTGSATTHNATKKAGPGRPPAQIAAPKRIEKGQSRLVFGK